GMNVTLTGNFARAESKVSDFGAMAEKRIAISLRDGNIFCATPNEEKQLTFCSRDSHPISLSDGKILFIRYEEGIKPSIEDDTEMFTYHRHKIMTVNIETGLEEIITDRKPFIDGVDATNEILQL